MAMMAKTLILLVASMSTLVILVSGNNISRIFGPSRLPDDNTRRLSGIFKRQAREKGFSESQKAELLKWHNEYRRNEGATNMLEMYWDRDLEKFAQQHVEKCDFEHSTNEERKNLGKHDRAGENLYISTGGIDTKNVLDEWFNEKTDYNFDTKHCPPEKMCGHYTQVVWHDSWALGCGVYRCSKVTNGGPVTSNGLIVSCVYGPPGNRRTLDSNTKKITVLPIYTKGTPCSECPADRICKDRLCALPEGSRPPGQPGVPEGSRPPGQPGVPEGQPGVPEGQPSTTQPTTTQPSSCEVVQAHLLISTIIMASQLLLLF